MNTIITKVFYLLFMIVFISAAGSVERIKPVGKYCEKVTGITIGLADYIGSKLRTDARSISFKSSSAMKDDYYLCPVRVDTLKGPQICSATDIYIIDNAYIAGGMCL